MVAQNSKSMDSLYKQAKLNNQWLVQQVKSSVRPFNRIQSLLYNFAFSPASYFHLYFLVVSRWRRGSKKWAEKWCLTKFRMFCHHGNTIHKSSIYRLSIFSIQSKIPKEIGKVTLTPIVENLKKVLSKLQRKPLLKNSCKGYG